MLADHGKFSRPVAGEIKFKKLPNVVAELHDGHSFMTESRKTRVFTHYDKCGSIVLCEYGIVEFFNYFRPLSCYKKVNHDF